MCTLRAEQENAEGEQQKLLEECDVVVEVVDTPTHTRQIPFLSTLLSTS